MVVCKCRKATRLYCFVHKVPVCGECIGFSEHQICVVKKYSDWVIDGEYDWPPKCLSCNSALGETDETTRLGCLHLMHTKCLVSHIQSFPAQTTPAGYVCPACSTPIWPPTSIKDTGSALHSKLKEAIVHSGMEKNVFGNHQVTMPRADMRAPPPAFSSDPLVQLPGAEHRESNGVNTVLSISTIEPEIVEIDGPNNRVFLPEQESNYMKNLSPLGPNAMTRKTANYVDRQNSETSYYADDEDGNSKKYARRGSLRHKLLRLLVPFWSSALPTLPVTAPPPRKDSSAAATTAERHQRSSRMDPRKILLYVAILACLATMGILYYRLAQRALGDNFIEEEEPQ